MRLPLIPNIESRDGIATKGGRLTNALREQNSAGDMMISRPGLIVQAVSSGAGYGLVSFNDELVSVYGATIGVASPEIAKIVFGEITRIDTLVPAVVNAQNVVVCVSDGATVRGYSTSIASGFIATDDAYLYRAWRWEQSKGQVLLPVLDDEDISNYRPICMSEDGNTIFGVFDEPMASDPAQTVSGVWRWNSVTGIERLWPSTVGTDLGGWVRRCSSDGKFAVGLQDNGVAVWYVLVWDQINGTVEVGFGPQFYIGRYYVSEDGNIVIAETDNPDPTQRLFRWVRSTTDPTTGTLSYPTVSINHLLWGCADDCSIIVLSKRLGGGLYEIYTWTLADGLVLIGASGLWSNEWEDDPYQNEIMSGDGTTITLWKRIPLTNTYETWQWTALTGFQIIGGADEILTTSNEDGTAVAGVLRTDFTRMPVWNVDDDVVYYDLPTGCEWYNQGYAGVSTPVISRAGLTIGGHITTTASPSDVVPFILGGVEVLGRIKQVAAVAEQFYDFAQSPL